MNAPITPANEAQRLAALRALHILDSRADENFDRIAKLTQQFFDVPIVLISLIDTNRQWFRSCVGYGIEQTPRDISFCGHAILQDDALVIEDTLKDTRFCDNPLVTGAPFIRFYAGHPIRTNEGLAVGTICLIDHSARVFGPDQQLLLKDFAALVDDKIARLQESNRRSEVFSMVSHELRTPAAAIEMMTREIADEELRNDFAAASQHLMSVIDDLRWNLQPNATPEIHAEPFVVAELMRQIERQIHPLLYKRAVSLRADIRGDGRQVFVSDPYRLRSILSNLVRNAFLHSAGTLITLTADVTEDRVEFIVEDNGTGIAATDIDRLFRLNERGDTQAGGTGTGLFIVKDWIERLGGSVNYRRADSGGSRFTVTLQPQRAMTDRNDKANEVLAQLKLWLDGKRVLLVEDDPLLCKVTAKVLRNAFNIDLTLVDAAEKALPLADTHDLILTDYSMPNMNGAEFITALRAQGNSSPVLALTSAVGGVEEKELLQAGALGVMSKPLKLEVFATTLLASPVISRPS